MENIRKHMLKVEDPKFFQKVMADLSNVNIYLQPIYNNVLKYRFKSQQLRSLMAKECVPMIIQFKEKLEERTLSLNTKTQEMKNILQTLDETLYEKFSIECETDPQKEI